MASWRELQEEIREELEERKSKTRGLNPKRKALVNAIRQQNLEKVDRLLNQGVDPNFRDASGNFPLHLACSAGLGVQTSATEQIVAEQIVERLVFVGAELQVQDRFSRQPMHIAASGNHRILGALLDRGCSVNAQDNAGCTALMEACRNNSTDPLDTVTLLLRYNANVHLTDDQGLTALHCLCQNSTVDTSLRNQVALLLLQAGLSATTCDREGRMALCYELDKLRWTTWRTLPQVGLQLMETLVCAGSNLRPHCRAHQYWVRFALTTVSHKVLLMLLQLFAPVLTRPSLHMICKAVMDLKSEGLEDKDEGTDLLQAEVTHLIHSVDSLQCICRLSLRAHLRGKLLVGVPQLPLPNKLKNFLLSTSRKPV